MTALLVTNRGCLAKNPSAMLLLGKTRGAMASTQSGGVWCSIPKHRDVLFHINNNGRPGHRILACLIKPKSPQDTDAVRHVNCLDRRLTALAKIVNDDAITVSTHKPESLCQRQTVPWTTIQSLFAMTLTPGQRVEFLSIITTIVCD